MFMSADILVQTVMVGLAFASLVTWTVWLAKNLELWAAMRKLRRALAAISGERSLAEAHARVAPGRGIVPALIDAAMLELRLSSDLADKSGIKERIATRLARLEVAAGRGMNRGTGVLATIGATAPFVGLFGTVWGIMNSFIGISKAQTTNLAVVAPGIAEALLATAIGLVRGHPGRHHLQSVHPLDCPLPGAGRRRLGRGAAPGIARSRPRARRPSSSSRRRSEPWPARIDDGDDDGAELHEINVTPFIDVMLVLLIIFMVAAPLSTVDVAVDLPVSTAKPQPRPDKPLFVTIKADLSLAIGNDPIPRGQLAQAVDAATETDRQKRIFLRADKTVPYGELMIVMNLLRAGGYLKLALVGLEGAEGSALPAPGEAPAPVAAPPPSTAQPPRP